MQYVYAPSLAACSQPASGSLVLCIRYASQDGLWVVTCDSRGNAREHLPKGAKYSYSWTQFLQYVATGVLVERGFQCMMASCRRDGQGQNSVDRQGGALIDLQRHDADAAVPHSSRRYGPCDWSEAPLLMGHLELLYAVPPQLATLVSRLVQLERLKPTEKSLLGTLEPETLLMLTRTAFLLMPSFSSYFVATDRKSKSCNRRLRHCHRSPLHKQRASPIASSFFWAEPFVTSAFLSGPGLLRTFAGN